MQSNFWAGSKIWTGTKHFGTCRRTRHKFLFSYKIFIFCFLIFFQDGEGGPGKDHMEIKNENQITIDNLHPYSKYKLSIKPLPIYKIKIRKRPEQPEDLFVDTLQGLPDVAPSKSDLPFRWV